MHILVIEDSPDIGSSIDRGFQEVGHHVTWAVDGDRGLDLALKGGYDCLVLDLMLPGRNGLQVLEQVRARGVMVPCLILTALGTVDDRVRGLQSGGDDYLVKPFAFAELRARVEAICRRLSSARGNALHVAGLSLDVGRRRASFKGLDVDLTPTESSLLELLMRHAGRTVTRKMLCEHLWQADWEGETNVIEVHVNRLRGKLDRHFQLAPVHTVRGQGYVLRLE